MTFAPAYELFGLAYLGQFSDDLFDNFVYSKIATPTLIVTIIAIGAYYFLFSNYGQFYKRRFWFLWLFLISTANFGICFYIVKQSLYDIYGGEYPENYEGSIYMVSFINVLWTLLIGFILSIIFKIKSVQASRTPF